MKKLFSQPSLCVNCRICEMSCSLKNAGVFNPVKARVWIHRSKKGEDTPMICRQCISAPCVQACPVEGKKPLWRDETSGIVRFEEKYCIGCYECVKACPFSAMRVDPHSGKVFKCDLCGGDPECAKWCPTGAIRFVDKKAVAAVNAADKI